MEIRRDVPPERLYGSQENLSHNQDGVSKRHLPSFPFCPTAKGACTKDSFVSCTKPILAPERQSPTEGDPPTALAPPDSCILLSQMTQ